jgi:hypothetical protein
LTPAFAMHCVRPTIRASIEDIFNLIAEKHGPEAAARCQIVITLH